MALHLSTFTPPPTDGSIALAEVIDFHLDANPAHPFAILYNVESQSQTSLNYKELAYAVHRAAYMLNPGAMMPQGTSIGILISTDTLTYIALVLGAMRAGLVVRPFLSLFWLLRSPIRSASPFLLTCPS